MAKKRRNRKKADVPREPSGRPSRRAKDVERVAFEQDVRQTAYKARRRHMKPFRQPDPPERRVGAVGGLSGALRANDDPCQAYRDEQSRPVTKAEAERLKLNKRGSVIGALNADGKISDEQLRAGEDYCQRYLAYLALNGLPAPTPQGPSYGEVRGGSRAERLRQAMAAKLAHMEDQAVLRHCSAGVVFAMKRACVEDKAAPLHLVKEGLAALVREGR